MESLYEDLWDQLPTGLKPYEFARRREFLLAGLTTSDRMLDLGCGEGDFAAVAADVCDLVVAADIATGALERARQRHPDLDLRIVAPHGPFEFDDGSFTVVWASEVLEHVADTARWLSEVRRILAPGGRLLITTPFHGRISLATTALRGSQQLLDPVGQHLRYYTASSLRLLLEDFAFGEIDVRSSGGPPLFRRMLLARAAR
ncbi:MAG: methyltransferase domain-containing protein [Actinomycetota bacterium]